jgi:oleate hydratase
MFYSNGNYEAFVTPRKPKGVDEKSAFLVGGGIASLTAAGFLIRDGQMDPKKITIYEASNICGGCLDGIKSPAEGYLFRGEREMEDHYECLWDLMRSIPSLDIDGSVLDDYYRVNKDYPNYSLCRTIHKRGQPFETDGKMLLTPKSQTELMKLFFTHRRETFDKRFDEFVSEEFFKSNFWVYWLSMFAIGPWHGALEMKLYMNRFVQHFGGMADLSTIKFTRLNQYDSLVLPLVKWLEEKGVNFVYDTKVTNVVFDLAPTRKVARRIEFLQGGKRGAVDLTENDLVFITNGSAVENTAWGDHHTPPKWNKEIEEGSIWALWRNIAAQDPAFGNPDKFCTRHDESAYVSGCLVTRDDKLKPYIQRICQRDPYRYDSGPITGGLVTIRDSNWMLSFNVERNPHFRDAPKNQFMAHCYGTYSLDRPGNYVKKAMKDCTGEEIAKELFYHIGVPDDQIDQMAAESVTVHPCMMPYITSFFLTRKDGDRPKVNPDGAVNFAFLGQLAESHPRDVIFTVEYSVRTAMEAVFTLLDVERGVPEPWASQYDIRAMLNSGAVMRDGMKIDLPRPIRALVEYLTGVDDVEKTEIYELLRDYGWVGELEGDRLTVAIHETPPRVHETVL